MTIGIGVLATEENDLKAKPSHVVFVADTMGSFEDEDSHPRLHKIFAFPETDLYATSAGSVDQAAVLLPMISAHLSSIPPGKRSYGDIIRGIAQTVFMFKMEKFNLTVLPRYGMPPGSIAPHSMIGPSSLIAALAAAPASVHAQLQKEWQEFNLGCDLIIGAFDREGQAAMVYVYGNDHAVYNANFPGYCAIGSGAGNAMFWLSHRQHVLGMRVKRAAYHAYEAKLMAEGSPYVNEHLDITIATKGQHWSISTHKLDSPKDCPVTFGTLKGWYAEFGPKATDLLDRPEMAAASG